MVRQMLETVIAINARVGNGFSQVGATLTELGSMVNGASQQLIDFGKESVTVYREYEKSMASAEVALSTVYGRGTKELNTVMGQLDVAATEWAASTIFHTNDVGNAISEAAHAGWDFNQIMTGLPAAMQLAQAGGLDLSEAVDYIVKSTNAAGIGFEDMSQFIDLWAFAANSSATNIDEVGEAMLRMGSTMRWASDPAELLTLIAVTANAGSVGSEAGTMIRNSIMRLIAPTDKAEEALGEMGATAIEALAVMNDEKLFAAYEELTANGFKGVYDEKGNLRSILDIYSEMAVVLGNMSGGVENIANNDKALGILSAIFPTRTVTEAINLITAASNNWDGLYDKMINGEATGYGEYAATTMMDTLDGKIETFESKVERLKQLVGGELSGRVEQATGFIGGMVDSLAEMDSDNFDALVTGLEVIAAAGPGLLLAGGAFRLIGHLLTPTGFIGLGLTTLTAFVAATKELEQADFVSNFGNMKLDTAGIQSYVASLGEGFKAAYTEVDGFKSALDEAVTSYQTASATFSATLFQGMITNTQLTDADKKQLQQLGIDMFSAVQDAIDNSTAASMSYWKVLFGGDDEAEFDPAYQEIINKTKEAHEAAISDAKAIGQGLRDALTSAFEDGEISGEEYENILSYMQSYNEAIARAAADAADKERQIEFKKSLFKAQNASLADIQDMSDFASTQRDENLAAENERFIDEYVRAEDAGASAESLARVRAIHERKNSEYEAQYDEFLSTLWGSQIQQSGQADNFAALMQFANQYLNGELTSDTIEELITGQMGQSIYAGQDAWGADNSDRAQLGKLMGFWVNALGGEENIRSRISYYEQAGNADAATMLRQVLAAEQLVNGFSEIARVGDVDNPYNWLNGDFETDAQGVGHSPTAIPASQKAATESALGINNVDYSIETARKTIAALGDGEGSLSAYFDAVRQSVQEGTAQPMYGVTLSRGAEREFGNLFEQLSASYDLDRVLADSTSFLAEEGNTIFAIWDLLYGEAAKNAEKYKITVPVKPEFQAGDMPDMEPITVPIEPKAEGEDSMTALQDQGVTVDVGADATELTATIDGADGLTLIEYLDGDATDLMMKITDQNGKTLVENVTGDATSLAGIIERYDGQTITVNITGKKLFAEGGRATSASIFGEAGPEWAIPEEHSERTADLLNAARAASGFTWPDILARFGGLNSSPNNQPTTIIYSPTINAADATGVDQVLREDKKRLDKWYEEKKMRDEVEVYS